MASSSSKPGGDPAQQLLEHMRREREGVRMANNPQGSSSFSNPLGNANAANVDFLAHQLGAADLSAMDTNPGAHDLFRPMPHGLHQTGPAMASGPGPFTQQHLPTAHAGQSVLQPAQQPHHAGPFARQSGPGFREEPIHQQALPRPSVMAYRQGPMLPHMMHQRMGVPPMAAPQMNAEQLQAKQAQAEEEFDALMNEWMLKEGFEGQVADWSVEQIANQATPSIGPTASQGIANFVNGEPIIEPAAAVTEAIDQENHSEDNPLSSTDLARAAQQLVDAVSDNQSEKFRNSSFVEMMRRIAAQEVVIQGNNLVDASQADQDGHPSHVTGTTATESELSDPKGKGKANAS